MTNDEHYKQKQDERAVESVVQPNNNGTHLTTNTLELLDHPPMRLFPAYFHSKPCAEPTPPNPTESTSSLIAVLS